MIHSIDSISFALRSLYRSYGYLRYKMSKFEEYDFYVRNKDFLISDSVITFTDTNGRLMALKPDVTLSIVKNSRDVSGSVQKVFYNENVYRVSESTHSFREIVQLGLECIGDVDDYCIYEVVSLAAQSLRQISPSSVLTLSHLGVFSQVLRNVPDEIRRQLMRCVRDRNAHEIRRLCDENGLNEEKRLLTGLLLCHGKPADALAQAERLMGACDALAQLQTLAASFDGTALAPMLRVDFSVVGDINYYNGVLFKGFVQGVPTAVLSGGQYDRLMRKMGREAGAIGFAVYTDLLEQLSTGEEVYDADALLLYPSGASIAEVARAVDQLKTGGRRVIAQRTQPEKLRVRETWQLIDGEVIRNA